jgi:hypothetical protein
MPVDAIEPGWYGTIMVNTLERALAEVAALPEAAQEQIGRDLLVYLEKLRGLRATIDASIAGGGRHTDEEVEASIAARLDTWERKRKGE